MFTPRLLDLERRAQQDPALVEELFVALLDHDELEAAAGWLKQLVAAHRVNQPYRALRLLEQLEAFTGTNADAEALRTELGVRFEFERLSVPEAKSRLRERSGEVRLPDDVADAEVHWVEGSLVVPHLELQGEVLVVTGALEVAGSIIDSAHPLSAGVVLGGVSCAQAVMRGPWHVGGGLEVHGLWYLNSGNDHQVSIAGDVRVEGVLEDGMRTSIGGQLRARHLASRHNQLTTAAGLVPHGDASPAFLAALACEPTVEALSLAARDEVRVMTAQAA